MEHDGDRFAVEEMLGDVKTAVYSVTKRFAMNGSYRELAIAKTKLEEAEMWLQKLLGRSC